MQWWWRSPRSTDRVPQPFWFDASGRPVAAVIATDWGEAVALDPIVLPDAAPSWVARVVEIGVGHAQAVGLGPLEVVVDRADRAMRALLEGLGFVVAHGAPLYRPELDLVVLDDRDAVAAYGLFWFDPITATGLVEPMRTEAAHQGRGLARHVLAAGIERLVAAGARRVKVCFHPGNAAARRLYLGAGFEVGKETVVLASAAAPVAVPSGPGKAGRR